MRRPNNLRVEIARDDLARPAADDEALARAGQDLRQAEFTIRITRKEAARHGIELEPKPPGKPGKTNDGR